MQTNKGSARFIQILNIIYLAGKAKRTFSIDHLNFLSEAEAEELINEFREEGFEID